MKTSHQLAAFCEAQLADKLSFFNDSKVTRLTPSIQANRRFIQLVIGDDAFLVTIEVEKAEEA